MIVSAFFVGAICHSLFLTPCKNSLFLDSVGMILSKLGDVCVLDMFFKDLLCEVSKKRTIISPLNSDL